MDDVNKQVGDFKVKINLDDFDTTKLKPNEICPRNIFKIDMDSIQKINIVTQRSNVAGRIYFLDNDGNLGCVICKIYYDLNTIKSYSYFIEIINKYIVYISLGENYMEDRILYFDDYRDFSDDYKYDTRYQCYSVRNIFELSRALIPQLRVMFYNAIGYFDNTYKYIFFEDEFQDSEEFDKKLKSQYTITDTDTNEEKIYKVKFKEILKQSYEKVKFLSKASESIITKK